MLLKCFLGSSCAMGALLLLATSGSAAVNIAAHRAVYDLVLKDSNNSAGLANADGRMAFEVSGSDCEGWTVNFRMVNQFKSPEENPRLVDTRSSSWESGDGLNMRFTQSEFVDNALDNEKMLSAKREKLGVAGDVTITKPADKSSPLSADALFPIQHQKKLMMAMENGQMRDASLVYDGSDDENAYRTISFIGKRKDPGTATAHPGKGLENLKTLPAWPVSISYFEDKQGGDAGEQTPVYQVSFDMFENGVADELILNYGDFALKGELSSLEYLNQPACN